MKNKLIPMVDYVLENDNLSNILNYADFLYQKLEIWMFVPCDEDGNVLEEPLKTDFIVEANKKCGGWDYVDFDNNDERHYNKPLFKTAEHKYQNVKERVLFEGFEVKRISESKDNHYDCICKIDSNFTLWFKDVGSTNWKLTDNSLKTIEDMVKYNLQLTDKQAEILKL